MSRKVPSALAPFFKPKPEKRPDASTTPPATPRPGVKAKVAAAATLILILFGSSEVAAQEPTRFYLIEDGKAAEKRIANLERELADLKKTLGVKSATNTRAVGGKVLMYRGQPLADQDPNGYFSAIKAAWPGGRTVETATTIEYFPDPVAWEADVYALRPIGPTTIITPSGGTATVTAEGAGVNSIGGFLPHGWETRGTSPAVQYSSPVSSGGCANGQCSAPSSRFVPDTSDRWYLGKNLQRR